MATQRSIIHIDMDAFYASVEQRDNPKLKDKPVVVGGSAQKRGVVSAASYMARRFGVHSAMPMSKALRLCPDAVVLPVDMNKYSRVSKQIREIFARYTPEIEPISLDEAFLDVTGSVNLFGSAEKIGRQIKADIKQATLLTASVGIAPNKFLAKLASDLEKPDGFVVVTEQNKKQILDSLGVGKLWGVGKVTQRKLEKFGIRTIKQLRQTDRSHLVQLLGESAAQTLAELARGVDERAVEPHRPAKSVSGEYTFGEDIDDVDVLLKTLRQQVEEVAVRLRKDDLKAATVSIKLRYANFKTLTRSKTLPQPTNTTSILCEAALAAFEKWKAEAFGALRLIGFEASGLTKKVPRQLMLFEQTPDRNQSKLDEAIDNIRRRFGKDSLRRDL